jgi:hypothetical protein
VVPGSRGSPRQPSGNDSLGTTGRGERTRRFSHPPSSALPNLRLVSSLMEAPRRYSVSPLPSYTVDRPGGRSPSITEMLRELVAAYRPSRRRKSIQTVFREARMVDALAEELDSLDSAPVLDSPTPTKKRRRKAQ